MSRKITIRILSIVFIFSLAAWVIPNYIRARSDTASAACLNNLRQIDGGKQEWAVENHKSKNEVPTWYDVRPYVGRGANGSIPVCPQGGTYILGRVGEPPRCSIGGPQHTLDYDYLKEGKYNSMMEALGLISFIGLIITFVLSRGAKQ
jgi:hypothetical protein